VILLTCWDLLDAYRKILLVGKDQEDGIPELVLVEHALELLTSLDDTVTIVGIDNEDDALGVLEVMSPQRTDLVLTTNIPHGELDVLVLHRLDVEACARGVISGMFLRLSGCYSESIHTDGGNGGDDLAELKLVEDGGLSGGIETNHEDSHLLLSPKPVEQFRKCHTHLGGVVGGMMLCGGCKGEVVR
jgi:hypothetical protein